MYIYIRSEPGYWKVGCYTPDNIWHPDSNYSTKEQAVRRVHYLNGGTMAQRFTPESPAINERRQNMIEFARRTLNILAKEKEWSSMTVDDIQTEAFDLNLATVDNEGYFTRK